MIENTQSLWASGTKPIGHHQRRTSAGSVQARATIRPPIAGVRDSCSSIWRWISAALSTPDSISSSRTA
jgi:hypothetical protein